MELDDKVSLTLCMAKGKISPLKGKKTIPRLELLGLELGSRLISHINQALLIDSDNLRLWSDSTTALDWINITERGLQVFVKNRCAAILPVSYTHLTLPTNREV